MRSASSGHRRYKASSALRPSTEGTSCANTGMHKFNGTTQPGMPIRTRLDVEDVVQLIHLVDRCERDLGGVKLPRRDGHRCEGRPQRRRAHEAAEAPGVLA